MKSEVRCLKYKLQLIKLSKKVKKLEEKIEMLEENNEYLFNEVDIFKKLIRKRYITADEQMAFLIKREKKLQNIEQMEKNKQDFRKIRKVIQDV